MCVLRCPCLRPVVNRVRQRAWKPAGAVNWTLKVPPSFASTAMAVAVVAPVLL